MSERDDFQLDDIVEVTDDIYSNGLADAFMGKSDKLPANSRGKITDIDFLCDPNGYSIEVTFDKGGRGGEAIAVVRVVHGFKDAGGLLARRAMTIVDYDSVCGVGVEIFNFEIVDKTIWTHSSKRSVTATLENLNTVHPSSAKSWSRFLSSSFRSRARCEFPSTSIPIINAVFAISSLYAGGYPAPLGFLVHTGTSISHPSAQAKTNVI
jgi:hypothetical protein